MEPNDGCSVWTWSAQTSECFVKPKREAEPKDVPKSLTTIIFKRLSFLSSMTWKSRLLVSPQNKVVRVDWSAGLVDVHVFKYAGFLSKQEAQQAKRREQRS